MSLAGYRTICKLACLATILTPVLFAQEHWVATWAASPQTAQFRFPLPRPAAAPANSANAPTNQAPPVIPPAPKFNNQTLRLIVRSSIGGRRVVVHLSNAYGTEPLHIGAAHIALREKDSSIVSGSDRALTFSGSASTTIPAGAEMLSDPVEFNVPKLADIAVSVFVPAEVASPTAHLTGLHTTYISKDGDFTSAASIADATNRQSWYWLSEIDVAAERDASLIVAFGDSITDGATSTPDTDHSWPSLLAKRLEANKSTANVAIVNEGISGNRLLADGAGISALARFDRDVLSQPGIKWIIVLEGINDIGLSSIGGPQAAVTTDELIGAQKQLIERAHEHGIKIAGATLTPYQGAAYYSDQGETMREALNEWIRTSKAYDAVIDFDQVTRDPANPKQIRADLNIRDHLHPNDAGYQAMADAVDLALFTKK
ncbi:MAG TPA: SGNH/GDSL hydrolase family protein [Bryobacteraceae bacterium]|nr:SGNH/GDSL hydrolase family protein [Bryobacteraceae bacterium]